MFLGQEHVIFDWFIIHFTENNGMAFGLEFGGYAGKKITDNFENNSRRNWDKIYFFFS